MESLYRKYRPQTFADVVGQKHVVETLERAVTEGKTSHAYLFCGPRGTGKTTMARLLAKALLCEAGPNALPDGTCEQCRLIAAGEHPDVYELDAASRTGVDNVREEIINRVGYAPVRGRYKVYIIDEVHMLTTAAFNALLKTLEEPPSHIVFVLCTTDPQKVPETILSRVQRFDFHSISSSDIEGRLAYVCDQEGFTYDADALELVCRHARGGMRDALSTLEQLSVFGDGHITVEATRDLLGEVSTATLSELVSAIAARDVPTLFSEVARLVDDGHDLLQLTRELTARVRDLYVMSIAGTSEGVVQASGDELSALEAEVAAFGSPDRLSRVLVVLGGAADEMRFATNQRLALEVALTRVARPKCDLTLESLAERIDALERRTPVAGVAASSAPAAVPTPIPAPVAAPVPAPAAAPVAVPVAAPAATPAPEPVEPPAPEPAPVAIPAPAPAPAVVSPAPVSSAPSSPQGAGQLQRAWRGIVEGLLRSNPSVGSLLMKASATADDGEQLTVTLPKGSSFAAKMLEREDVRQAIQPLVTSAFGPRRMVYVESSLIDVAMARAEAVPAPAPAPVPAPAPASTPAPAPAPAPAPVPAQAPAPAVTTAPVPAPTPTSDPVPDAIPVPDDDLPPIELFDEPASPYDDAEVVGPDGAPVGPSAPVAVSDGSADGVGGSEDPDAGVPDDQGTPAPTSSEDVPAALTSMLADVFGEGVTVTTTSAPVSPDEAEPEADPMGADDGVDGMVAPEFVDDADDDDTDGEGED